MLSMPRKLTSVAHCSTTCRLLSCTGTVASSVEFWTRIQSEPRKFTMVQSIQSTGLGLRLTSCTSVGGSLTKCLRTSARTFTSPSNYVCLAHLSSQTSTSTASVSPTPSPGVIKPGDWSIKDGKVVREGSLFQDFLGQGPSPALVNSEPISVPYLSEDAGKAMKNGRMYVETYGCQMNVNDMEIVLSIMKDAGYSEIVYKPEEADIIFINTCAIRENAEHKIWQRLNVFRHMKRHWNRNVVSSPTRSRHAPKVAVLGCMAERLKVKLLDAEKMVDVVCGPDAYRDLPRLLSLVDQGQTGINTMLSLEETYADVSPVRLSSSQVSAYVSIMRGCNNMCSFCIVPFTRGRERSRPVDSIVREVGELWEQGVKEVVLLGQNVNSYNDISGNVVEGYDGAWIRENAGEAANQTAANLLSPGFTSISQAKEVGLTFANLLDCLSTIYPQMRFRFTSPHPKHFPEELLYLMKDRPNICKAIHLPAQSGSSTVLEKMRRGYTREAYLELVDRIRTILPDASISSDFITGFCGETEEDHQDTLSLLETVGYDMAYMFAYSMREKTHAHRNYVDDVPEDVKQRRLAELITTFRGNTGHNYRAQLGTTQLVLIEGPNKRNPEEELIGRTDRGHKVVFPNIPVPDALSYSPGRAQHQSADHDQQSKVMLEIGDYVEVEIESTTLASLRGMPTCRTDLLTYHAQSRQLHHDHLSVNT